MGAMPMHVRHLSSGNRRFPTASILNFSVQAERTRRITCMPLWRWRPNEHARSWRPMTCGFWRLKNLRRMRLAFASEMGGHSMILAGSGCTPTSSICAARRRWPSCLPTSLRRWRTPSRLRDAARYQSIWDNLFYLTTLFLMGRPSRRF